jgi:heme exporter protein C
MSSRNSALPALALGAVALMAAAVAMVFFVAPEDADQGISQKIFYFHVPIALTAYACFGLGAWKALRLLWVGGERRDLESYTAIHQGTIFGALTLITGSIWAKASWGVWWSWGSNQLVLFLVLFLFYCAYFMLRFSLEEGPRRERISAVYALFGVALIPVSFFAIRLANDFIHPTVFTSAGPQMTGTMFAAFLVAWAAIRRSPTSCTGVEIVGKRTDAHLRDYARGHCREPGERGPRQAPCSFVLLWVAIIAAKLARLEREAGELAELARSRRDDG